MNGFEIIDALINRRWQIETRNWASGPYADDCQLVRGCTCIGSAN